jgi:Ferritin-like
MLRLRRSSRRLREPLPSMAAAGADESVAALRQEPDEIIRDFDDPYLELVRLLREASEIEHALLVQYLYAAFSVTSQYPEVSGTPGLPNARNLVGVAVQEMQHLHTVNRLLVTIGAGPGLASQDFPYEPDIYPFPLHLEPMSQASLARYVYAEAPAGALNPDDPDNAGEDGFLDRLFELLGQTRPNHLGSLYGTIIGVVGELSQTASSPLPDPAQWEARLEAIKGQGERDHFLFFKQLFLGTHSGFRGEDVWSFSPGDPRYPALALPVNPSAYEGHPSQIEDKLARQLAWLGNLQYWIVLMLLDLSYRRDDVPIFLRRARAHMTEPLWRLGKHLATLATGLPFDPLSMGYAPGTDIAATLRILRHLLSEAEQNTTALRAHLPATYPFTTNQQTLERLETIGVD